MKLIRRGFSYAHTLAIPSYDGNSTKAYTENTKSVRRTQRISEIPIQLRDPTGNLNPTNTASKRSQSTRPKAENHSKHSSERPVSLES